MTPVDPLPIFIGGMLTGIFITIVLSGLAIAFYKSEIKT